MISFTFCDYDLYLPGKYIPVGDPITGNSSLVLLLIEFNEKPDIEPLHSIQNIFYEK